MSEKNKQWLLLFLLMAGAVTVVGQLYAMLPLVAALAVQWGVAPSQAAWAGSVFGLAYAVGFLLLGRLSDRYGRRTVVLCSLLATALASVLVASAMSFGMFLGARALQGLVASAFPPVALALVAEMLAEGRRAWGISLMSFAFLAAAPLSQFLAVSFADLGLVLITLILALAYMLLALALSRVLPVGKRKAASDFLAPVAVSPWRQRELWGVWLAALTVLFAFVSFQGAVLAMGLSAADQQGLRLLGLPSLLLSVAAVRLVQKVGAGTTARVGMVLAALGLVAGTAGSFWWLVLASIVVSAGTALAIPGLIGTVAGCTEPGVRAQAMSVYSFFLFAGASIAPPVTQALQAYSGRWSLVLPAFALLCAAAFNGLAFFHPSLSKQTYS